MQKHKILKEYFGYQEFREGQEDLIDSILGGRDVLGIMPTGAGKSICYQVPALLLEGITIVISPLISLMMDQVKSLNEAGIHAAYINSSLTENQIAKALQFAAKGRYKIIYVAPERLETAGFLEFAKAVTISMITVDEAHCISQWGQDFRPSYVRILSFLKQLPKRPIISAFTATATVRVKEDIVCVLGLQDPNVLVTGFDRENLFFEVIREKKKDEKLLELLQARENESGIIYCATRKNVDAIYEGLKARGLFVSRYHAGLSAQERKENQADFIYDRSLIMVATNAFGMGIDKSNVRFVIHYNMPQCIENYYQEAGRGGRDGEPADCILMYSPQDVVINRFLISSKEENKGLSVEDREELKAQDELRLRAMTFYCTTTHCLRKYLLNYFGELGGSRCGHCSNCLQEFEETDVTKETIAIVKTIMECRQRYGVNVIVGVLRGEKTAKLRDYGLDKLSSYGILNDANTFWLRQLIDELIFLGYIKLSEDQYGILSLNLEAKELLEEKKTIMVKFAKVQEQSTNKKQRTPRNSDILRSKGLDLFEVLRKLRGQIASEEGVPPYIIFTDKSIVDMCVKLPFTKEEFLDIYGVGVNKYEKYGERVLIAIREFTEDKKDIYYYEDAIDAYTNGSNGAGDATKTKAKSSRGRKEEFKLTKDMMEQYQFKSSVTISELTSQLNELRDESFMKRVPTTVFTEMLADQGYIRKEETPQGQRTMVLEKGEEIGIGMEERISAKGFSYQIVTYKEQAQQFLIHWLYERSI